MVTPYVLREFVKLSKTSSSSSQVAFATLYDSVAGEAERDSLPIALKYFKDPASITSHQLTAMGISENNAREIMILLDSLIYEVRVYRLITERLLATRGTPNFVGLVSYGSCTSIPDEDSHLFKIGRLDADLTLLLRKQGFLSLSTAPAFMDALQTMPTSVLMTYRPVGAVSLNDWSDTVRGETRRQDELAIYLQLTYALYAMELLGLAHNDLHGGNVLIQTLDSPTTITMRVGRHALTVTTTVIPYIYDWDFANVPELGRNPKMDAAITIRFHTPQQFRVGADMFNLTESDQFGAPLNIIYGIPVVQALIQDKRFDLTPESRRIFEQLMADVVADRVEKGLRRPADRGVELTAEQLDELIGHPTRIANFGEGFVRGTFIASSFQREGICIRLARPESFQGRMTFETTDLPTPLDLLVGWSGFDQFRLREGANDVAREFALPLVGNVRPVPSDVEGSQERQERIRILRSLRRTYDRGLVVEELADHSTRQQSGPD